MQPTTNVWLRAVVPSASLARLVCRCSAIALTDDFSIETVDCPRTTSYVVLRTT